MHWKWPITLVWLPSTLVGEIGLEDLFGFRVLRFTKVAHYCPYNHEHFKIKQASIKIFILWACFIDRFIIDMNVFFELTKHAINRYGSLPAFVFAFPTSVASQGQDTWHNSLALTISRLNRLLITLVHGVGCTHEIMWTRNIQIFF